MHKKEICSYYDGLAANYDESRFGNSYGQYIHLQESSVLKKLLPAGEGKQILDFGCGTGRMMAFATHGMDPSPNMINEAQAKFPRKIFVKGDRISDTQQANSLDAIFSFHVLMHLEQEDLSRLINDARTALKPGGKLIFDIPSQKRRKLVNYQAEGWHGANSFTLQQVKDTAGNDWKVDSVQGLLFFPIHRIPSKARKPLIFLDNLLCKSLVKEFASYLLVSLEKK